ncbi:MAG: hypothetical protein Q9164_001690 [Protoblastenia rupestris]
MLSGISFIFDRPDSDGQRAIYMLNDSAEEYCKEIYRRLSVSLKAPGCYIRPKHHISIRQEVNDTEIPDVVFNKDVRELFLNWKKMFDRYFIEEHCYNRQFTHWVCFKASLKIHCMIDRNDKECSAGRSEMAEGVETKACLDVGEIDMSKAIENSVKMLARAMDESCQLVRRQQVHRQLKACGKDSVSEDWLKEHEQDALAKLKDIRFYASFADDSNDE